MKRLQSMLLGLAVLLLACSIGQAVVVCEYVPPGTPGNQGWVVDERDGVVVGDANDVAYGLNYPAWEILNAELGQRAWYLYTIDSSSDQQAILDDGWTFTYISRTYDSYAKGAHHFKVRDGSNYFDPYARQAEGSANNGFWIDLKDGAIQLAAMELDNDYHIFQMILTPYNPGSYDPCDLVEVYVDGEKVYEFIRDDLVGGTSLWRQDMGDFATGGQSHFLVNLFRVETGQHVTTQVFNELVIATDPCEARLADNTIPEAGTVFRARENAVVNIYALDQRESCPWLDFDTWTGPVLDPGDPCTTVTLDSNKAVTANFVAYDHVCGDECTPFEELWQRGDLHTDCVVDLLDFSVLAGNWLKEYDASSFVDY